VTRRQGRASIAAKLVMAASFLNSLAVTLPAVAIPVVIAGTAAYAFTFLEFPGRDLQRPFIRGLAAGSVNG
jgi:ABC-type glycerol-3-phosphate transport system permease component